MRELPPSKESAMLISDNHSTPNPMNPTTSTSRASAMLMKPIRKTSAPFGIPLAVLLAGLGAFAPSAHATVNSIAWANPATVSQSNISSTNGSPLVYVPGNPYAVGDEIYFNGTTAGSNPFGTSAARYYVIYSNGNNIELATTYNGVAKNAVNTIAGVATAQQHPDWLTGGNWTGGTAPNSSSTFASFPGAGGNQTPPGGIIINGNVTIYGLGWNNSSQDLELLSGSSGSGLYALTFATSDGLIPKITCTNSTGGVIFLGNSTQAAALKVNGTQGLIFNAGPGGAVTGSGTAATSSAPSKDIRVYNTVDWSGFSGGIQIERGQVSQQNGASVLPTTQTLTVGNAQTLANNLLAGLEMNGRDCTVDGLNGNALGRIYCSSSQGIFKIGNNNGSGTFAGVIGRKFDGTVGGGKIFLQKAGSGTETISGIFTGASGSTVTVNGGTLILTGTNSYDGSTTVSAGELVVSAAQSSPGAFTVASGATLDVTASGSSQLSPGTLTMNSGTSMLSFDNLASTSTSPLNPGTVALNGIVTVNINSGSIAPGTSYPLITWSSISGTGGFVLGNCPYAATLSTNVNTLVLNVATSTTNVWTGANNGDWDTTTTGNWTGGTGLYADGGVAVFDDTATGTTNVTVNQVVKPGLVLFNNSNLSYTVTSSSGSYIDNSSSLTVNGGGMVTLSGPNTYSGGTVLSSGQLNINSGGSSSANSAIGTGALTINGGALDNTSPGDVTLLPAIAQTWNGDFAYVGSVHNLNLGGGAVTLGANRQIAVTNHTLTVGGVVGDGGAGYSLTKTGNGTLALAAANTFSGGLTLSSGTVQAGSSTALGSGPTQLGAGTLDLNGNSLINSNNINNGAFVLTNSSASAGALTANSAVTTSFTIGAGAGGISVARLIDTGAPHAVTKVGAGTLTFNGAGYNNLMEVIVNAGTALFANTGGFTADRGVVLNAGTIQLNAVGNGSGKNANLINDSSAPFTINGGTFDLNGWNETVPTASGTGGIILNNAAGTTNTLTVGGDNGTNTYSGIIQNGSGVLALAKTGTGVQTLANTNTYTGGTTISAGTLQAGTNNVLPTTGGDVTVTGTFDLNGFDNAVNGLNGAGVVDSVTNTGSATLTVGANGDSGNFSGTIQNTSGTLALTKTGAGMQVLSGADSYAGPTTVSNGTLVVAGALSGSGEVNVHGPAVLAASNSPAIAGAVTLADSGATLSLADGVIDNVYLNGGLTLNSGNHLQFDISGYSMDSIAVNGTFTQAGTTTININAAGTPGAGTYTLVSGATGINAANFVLGNSLPGYTLALTSDASDLYLTVTVSAPATAYWNNHVDTVWSDHSGSTYNWDTDQSSGINAGTVPSAPSDVYFAAAGASSFSTTLGADFIVNSLTFNVANNVTIGGTNALTLNGPLTVGSGAGSDTISAGSLVLGVDQKVTVAAGKTLVISSPISGAHALNVNPSSSSGTLALSGSSSYTGGTTISGGTLALNNPTNTLPDTSAVSVNNGVLSIGANSDTVGAVTLNTGIITGSSGVLTGSSYNLQNGTNSASLGGSGAMTVTGPVFLAGNSTYSGGTTISSGTLQLGSGNALGVGSLTLGANTLDLNGQTITNLIQYTGAGTLANYGAFPAAVTVDAAVANVHSDFAVDTTGGNITLARLWSSSGTHKVTVTGGNTLTFDGNGYNNLIGIEVQHGTVVLANNGGYSLDRGMQLDYPDATVKLGGPGNGTAPNADLINNSGNPFYIYAGTFDVNGWNETVPTVYGTSPGVILNNAAGTNSTLSIGGDNNSASYNTYSGAMQDGTGVLSITKVGTGAQILSGSCTYSGNTTINNGQLQVSASAASPNSTFVVNTNGGLLFQTDSAFSIGGLSGGGNVDLVNGGSPISLAVGGNNASTAYSGVLSDDNAGSTLTKAGTGTLTLSGANTYTGLTTVSNGVLVISPNYVAGGNFTVNEGAVLGVSDNTAPTSAQIGTLVNGISGSGSSTLLFTSLPYPNNAPLTVNTLNPIGSASSVIVSNTAALSVGTYNLINYTNFTGSGFSAFALAPLPPGESAYLTNNTAASPKVIQLVVTAIAPQIWSGAVNGNWDINTTANWKLNSVATNYFNAEPVLFDDTVGGGQTAVNLVTNVQPNSVTVSNNTKNYTFTTTNGSGINALDGFVKNGAGTLALVNLTNSFTGSVAINAGTVLLSSSTLGGGNITDNSSLVFSNSTQLVSNTIAGTGSVTLTGGGSVELSGQNAYGDTKILNGTVQSDNAISLGNGTVTLGDGASANNATLQAIPNSASLSNSNAVTVAAGGSGVYTIQELGGRDYNLYGNVALNNALTLKATLGGALFVRGSIISGGSNPTLTIGGGGTVNKFVGLYGDNSSTFTGSIIVTNGGDLKTGLANTLTAANPVALDGTSAFDTGTLNQNIAGLNDIGAGGGTVYDNGVGLFLTLGGSGTYSFSGAITLTGGIVMAGSGQQTLTGANTYTGPTVVSNGTLVVNGSLAGGAVTVAGGTLAGSGTLNGATTVNAGAILAAGSSGIGTLVINSNLMLNAASTNNFMVTSGGISDHVAVAGQLSPDGSVIHVAGGTLGAGTYTLFTYGTTNGTLFNATPVFDTAPSGTPSIVDTGAGQINLVVGSGVNLTPTNITTTVLGGQLIMAWPADHTGWELLVQTNNLNKGVSGNTNDWSIWGATADSTTTNKVSITINATNLNEYYRLVYPPR
jgi:autotransporter-associated beta strand protein